MLFARQFANTWDEDGLHDHGETIDIVQLENAQSRLEATQLGVPPIVLAEFEEARPQLQPLHCFPAMQGGIASGYACNCQPPVAQGRYGLDLVNYLWDIKD
jgi:hypothetical protein